MRESLVDHGDPKRDIRTLVHAICCGVFRPSLINAGSDSEWRLAILYYIYLGGESSNLTSAATRRLRRSGDFNAGGHHKRADWL